MAATDTATALFDAAQAYRRALAQVHEALTSRAAAAATGDLVPAGNDGVALTMLAAVADRSEGILNALRSHARHDLTDSQIHAVLTADSLADLLALRIGHPSQEQP